MTARHHGAPGGGRTPRQDQPGGGGDDNVVVRAWEPAVVNVATITNFGSDWVILTDSGTLAQCRIALTGYGGGPLVGWFSGSVVGHPEAFADNNINFRVVAEAGGDTILSAAGDYFNASYMGSCAANFKALAGPAYTHVRVDVKMRNNSIALIDLADPFNPCNAVLTVFELAAFA